MKPVKILAENFKALDFTHELKPVTMFAGPNESGKTARLDAVLVALLGYHPAVGKQPSATIAFAGESRPEMTVHLEFDTGAFITRTFKRKADGDVSRTTKGEIPVIPPVLFDASDYLEDTAAGRIKTVFERIDVSEIAISDEDLLERLGKIEAVPAAVSVEAVKEMLALTQKMIDRRIALRQTTQLWLEELLKGLTDAAKGQKSLQDNASAQMQTLRPSGVTPKSVAEQIEALKAKVAELEKAKAELDSALNNFLKTEDRRKTLRDLIAREMVDVAKYESEQNRLQAIVDEYQSPTKAWGRELEQLKTDDRTYQQSAATMANLLKEQKERLAELEGKVKCPYCKSNRQGWKEEYKTELEAAIAENEKHLSGIKSKAMIGLDNISKKQADINASIAKDKEIEGIRNKIIDIKNALVLARKDATARATAQGELSGLEQITRPSDADIEAAKVAIRTAKEELNTLNDAENAYLAAMKGQDRYREIEKTLIGHQVRVEVYKQAARLVMDAQKEIVARAFDSILAPARRFTDGLIDGKLDYHGDELGVHTAAGWVSHKVMSGRGQDLAYLGLQVALAQQSPVKIILLDEFGDFDVATKVKVIERLLALTDEGFIDGALCADPRADDYRTIQSPRFSLIELQKVS